MILFVFAMSCVLFALVALVKTVLYIERRRCRRELKELADRVWARQNRRVY